MNSVEGAISGCVLEQILFLKWAKEAILMSLIVLLLSCYDVWCPQWRIQVVEGKRHGLGVYSRRPSDGFVPAVHLDEVRSGPI
jgi:hypothetical protein